MIDSIYRIAVIGPESSGKSVLCEGLARNYKTVWVKEYAREYLPELTAPYTLNDVVEIYMQQFLKEKELLKSSNKLLFIDTEFIIAKVWCESVFGVCPEVIEKGISNFQYDFYLLTSPDLPWEFDPLRENPGKGEYYFNRYKRILDERNFSYGIVEGVGETRLQNSIGLVERFLNKEIK